MGRWGYRRQNRHRLSKNGLWNLRPKRPIKASMQIKLLIFSGCIQQEPVKKYVIDYKYEEKKSHDWKSSQKRLGFENGTNTKNGGLNQGAF